MPEIILESESWIYRRLRHWRMMTPPTVGTMTIGSDSITLPADLLEPCLLWTTGTNQQFIEQRVYQDVIASWSYNGVNRVSQLPTIYYFDQTAIRFDSLADQAYPYALIYYQQPAPLATTTTNFLTATYPRLVRLACMAAACEWAKDSGVGNYDRSYFDQLAQDELEKAQIESDRAKRAVVGGAVLIGGGGFSGNYMGMNGGYY